MKRVAFNYKEGGVFKVQDEEKCASWLEALAKSHRRRLGELEYFFCSDEELLEINKQCLNHDFYTDIITFDSSVGNIISGEIYISVDRVKDNAQHYKAPFQEEMLRVMGHGALHLCGYSDKAPTDKQTMTEEENKAIVLFQNM